MEWVVINLTKYGMSGNPSQHMERWQYITQLMEQTVINLTTYETGGNQSHNLRKRWSSITQLMVRVVIIDYCPFHKLCD
jgi:hypothetical protein